MGFNKKSSGAVELIPNAKLTGIVAGTAPKDAVNYSQVFDTANTYSTQPTFSAGIKTDTISESTAAAGVTIDSVKLKDGGVSNSAGTIFAGFIYTAAQNNITAGTGGAIAITNYLTTINTDAGGDAFTLASPTVPGLLKKILLVVDGGGDAVITPTSLSGGTTITMNDATDYVILQWNGTAWVCIENSGCTIA